MAIDGKAIVTQGYWPAISAEKPLRVVTQGYAGVIAAIAAGSGRRTLGWVKLKSKHKKR